jgi:uncharacterized membrane protein YtjA (UPF0391 family)
MRNLIICSLLASITAIFSFTELIAGTLVVARIATVGFMILYMLSLVHIIYPFLKASPK